MRTRTWCNGYTESYLGKLVDLKSLFNAERKFNNGTIQFFLYSTNEDCKQYISCKVVLKYDAWNVKSIYRMKLACRELAERRSINKIECLRTKDS